MEDDRTTYTFSPLHGERRKPVVFFTKKEKHARVRAHSPL